MNKKHLAIESKNYRHPKQEKYKAIILRHIIVKLLKTKVHESIMCNVIESIISLKICNNNIGGKGVNGVKKEFHSLFQFLGSSTTFH